MAAFGARKFYEVPSNYTPQRYSEKHILKKETANELFRYIEEHCIGKETTFIGPYGARKGLCFLMQEAYT